MSAAPAGGPSAPASAPRYPINPWPIALTVTIATFMEALDTSIANVALPHIAGSLSASNDEATWVLTHTWSPTESFCLSADGCRKSWGASASI